MAIPKQVEERGKAADETLKKQFENTGDPALEPVEVIGDDPGLPKKKETPTEEQTWEHKFKVLQGKYDAEVVTVPEKERRIKDLESELYQVRKQMDQLSAHNKELDDLTKDVKDQLPAKKTVQQAEQELGVDFSKVLSEEELAALEDEGLDAANLKILAKVVSSVSQQAVAPVQQQVTTELDAVKKDTETVKKDTAENRKNGFYAKVNQIHDVAVINNDPGFLKWLDVSPPYNDKTRGQILKAAEKNMDLGTIKTMFEDFKTETGWKVVEKVPPKKRDLKNELEPDNSIAGDPPKTKTGKKRSQEEIKQFYSDAAKDETKPLGQRKYTPEEFKRIDNEISMQ